MKPVRGFTLFSRSERAFTLIELLVVIAIIAILSVVGITVFTGVQKSARDAKRRVDVDAIAKAYEVQMSARRYVALVDGNFSSGKKPQDPNTAKGDYFNWLAFDGSGFKVCAALDDNPNNACNTPATNCYCKVSTQGIISSSSSTSYDPSSTQYTLGLGGSTSSSCDPNGTLLSGLVGYWKMDELNGTTTPDSSGYGNNGTFYNGASLAAGQTGFGNAGSFTAAGSSANYVTFPVASIPNLATLTASAWVYITGDGTSGINGVMNGKAFRFFINNSNNSMRTQLYYTSNQISDETITSPTVTRNKWEHITFTYDGSNKRYYLNGNLIRTTPLTVTVDNRSDGEIGSIQGTGYAFNGQIDDVRIYNRPLSQPEITALASGCLSP